MMLDKTRLTMEMQGLRLDCVLRRLCPGLSLRAARRLIADGNVLLDGAAAGHAGRKVHAGEEIEFACLPVDSVIMPQAFLLLSHDGFYFFYKPRGMHTSMLAGRQNSSLESHAPRLLAEKGLPPEFIMLQRLDYGTAGIVAAAASDEAASWYREMEKQGLCQKSYHAALTGYLQEEIYARSRLHCANRKVTRWDGVETGQLEWTLFEPLEYAQNLTMARCRIKMGKRHQIRAHAASIRHPLAGDTLYGGSGERGFILEHYHLQFPGFDLEYMDCRSPLAGIFASYPAKDCSRFVFNGGIHSCIL